MSGNNKDIDRSLFDESLRLLRDLAEIQNGTPLPTYEKEWNEIMNNVWNFLEENENESNI